MLLAPNPTPAPGTPAWVVVAVALITAVATLGAAIWTQKQQAKAEAARATAAAAREDAQARHVARTDLYVRTLDALHRYELSVGHQVLNPKAIADQHKDEGVQRFAELMTLCSEIDLRGAPTVYAAVWNAKDVLNDMLRYGKDSQPADARRKARAIVIAAMRADLDAPVAPSAVADGPEAN